MQAPSEHEPRTLLTGSLPLGETWVIPHLFDERAAAAPDAIACRVRDDAGQWSLLRWREVHHHVTRLAAKLRHAGVKLGDRIAVLMPTGYPWHIAKHAILRRGGVIVGLDHHGSPAAIASILARTGASTLLVSDRATLAKLPVDATRSLRVLVWPELEVINSDPSPLPAVGAELLPDLHPDLHATLIQTSGTTGEPRSIAYSHHHLLLAARSIAQAFPQLVPGDRLICWLPMSHLFQRMMNLLSILRDVEICFEPDPKRVVQTAREVHPAVMIAVPRFYEKLYEGIHQKLHEGPAWQRKLLGWALQYASKPVQQRQSLAGRLQAWVLEPLVLRRLRHVLGDKLKFMVTGTAPTPAWLLQFFNQLGLPLLEAYGISENAVPMAANTLAHHRPGSVGRPFPANDIRIADDGEVLVRGQGVFKGYEFEPLDPDKFTAEGYYRTGDLGHLDPQGFLHLTGRKSDLIKTSTGRRIAPAGVEAAFLQSPLIEQMVVLGNGRKALAALIAPHAKALAKHLGLPDAAADLSSLSKHPQARQAIAQELTRLGQNLAEHERISQFALLPRLLSIHEGELTASLKLRRHVIESRYAPLLTDEK